MTRPAAAWKLLGDDPEGLDHAALRKRIAGAAAVRSFADAREAKYVRALEALGPEPGDPAKDSADRLQREQNISRGEAKRRAETAEQLGSLPETQDALENGRITGDHASAMASGRAKGDAEARKALDEAEDELLEAAEHESPEAFRKRVERFVADHRGDDGLDEHDRRKAANSVRFWNDREGMKRVSGAFDPDLGALIEAEIRRKSEERWRAERAGRDEGPVPESVVTNERRMAEALGEVCRRSAGADVRDGRRVRPRAQVILDYDTLVGASNAPGERRDGTPVPASVARRMCCDSGIVPVVLGGESVPLDWGRARRFSQPAQDDALLLQYETCTLFGCTMRAEWSETHHIEPFEPEGLTNLDNLTLGCDHCHDLVHRPGWGCRKEADGTVISWAPSGQTWICHPRRRQRPAGPQPAAASKVETYDQPVLV